VDHLHRRCEEISEWGAGTTPNEEPTPAWTATQAGSRQGSQKTVLNWFNDYPVPISWFDLANRKKVNCEAKLKTLQLLYYVQHDLPEPLWSVANDEGYDTPYNREENLCEKHSRGV
jgi:hypothetical protein